MPSNVTDVPGSQGPRQSGSVIVPTDVPTHTSTISFGSHLCRFAGGGLALPLSSSSDSPVNALLLEEDAALLDGVDTHMLDTAEVPEESAVSKLDGTDADCSCDFSTLLVDALEPLPMLVLLLLPPELVLPLPALLLPLPEEDECCWFDSCELVADDVEEILVFSLVDGGPGAFGVLLLLLNEGPVLEFDENKLVEVLVLVLF